MSSEIESNHRLEKAVRLARFARMPSLLSLNRQRPPRYLLSPKILFRSEHAFLPARLAVMLIVKDHGDMDVSQIT